jgi:hypothetical protein
MKNIALKNITESQEEFDELFTRDLCKIKYFENAFN